MARIEKIDTTRLGFRYISLSGLTCATTNHGKLKILGEPLESFLRSLLTSESIILINIHSLYLDNDKVVDTEAYPRIVPAYKQAFFLTPCAESIVFSWPDRELFYKLLSLFNSEDSWCIFVPKSYESKEALMAYLASFAETGQIQWEIEQWFVNALMEFSRLLIAPGGDGEFVDLYFEQPSEEQLINQAIENGLCKLGELEQLLGPIRFDSYKNRQVITQAATEN